MTRTMSIGIMCTLALSLLGCGVQDFGPFVEKYEQDFERQHPYASHAVSRMGHVLHAREFGAANSGQGVPFVLLHGFPDSLHLYDRLSPLLARQRRTIAFDFLGWGESEKPANHVYDAASLRLDLEAVIEHFQLKKMVLVAHDASGFPVIDWALDNPDRVAGIILLYTVYTPSAALIPPEAIARFSASGLRRDISVMVAKHVDSVWQSGHLEQVGKFFCAEDARETYLKIFSHQSFEIRDAFFGLNEVLVDEVRNRAGRLLEMRNFRPPVTIIFGAEDPYLNAGVAKEFDDIFPNSRLHLVENGCHYVQLDRPARVAALILEASVN